MTHESLISSTYPFSGKLIKIRVDEVLLPNGGLAKREIVVHRGAAAVVAIEDGQVLLERQYRHTAKRVIWEIPAGTLEEGEEPKICAMRELKEETGYIAEKAEELTHFFAAVGYSTEVIYVFMAQGLTKMDASPESDESIEPIMVPLEEAIKMIERNEIEDGKSIIGLLMAKSRIGSQ